MLVFLEYDIILLFLEHDVILVCLKYDVMLGSTNQVELIMHEIQINYA